MRSSIITNLDPIVEGNVGMCTSGYNYFNYTRDHISILYKLGPPLMDSSKFL